MYRSLWPFLIDHDSIGVRKRVATFIRRFSRVFSSGRTGERRAMRTGCASRRPPILAGQTVDAAPSFTQGAGT
jgi:hypothetical protein